MTTKNNPVDYVVIYVYNHESVTLQLWIEIYFPLIHSHNNNRLFLKNNCINTISSNTGWEKIVFEKQFELLEYCSPENFLKWKQKH